MKILLLRGWHSASRTVALSAHCQSVTGDQASAVTSQSPARHAAHILHRSPISLQSSRHTYKLTLPELRLRELVFHAVAFICFFVSLFGLASSAAAQTPADSSRHNPSDFLTPVEQPKTGITGPRFFVGVLGGFTSSIATNNIYALLTGEGGWIGGVQASYRVFKIATLHAEAVIKQKALTYTFNDIDDTTTFDHDYHRVTQLDIPVSIQIPLFEGPIRPYLTFGPAFGLLLNARYTLTRDIIHTSSSANIDGYAPVELTFNIGAGSLFMLDDTYSITADVQYSTTLINPYPQDRRDNGQLAPDVWKITIGLMRSF